MIQRPRQIASKSEYKVLYGLVFISGEEIIKIKKSVKRSLYSWVLQHPQVFQYPIANDWFNVYIYCHTEKQISPNLLLRVSFIELHKSMVGSLE